MATDASGWGNSYSQTNPWHDALLSNLTKSGQTGTPDPLANDPLTSSTTTSASRMLGSATPAPQQGGTLAQSLTGGSGTASSAGAYPSFNTMMRSAAPPVATQAAAPTYTASQGTPLAAQPAAVNATGPTDYSRVGSWNNAYQGPSIVTLRTQSGDDAYYQFDAKTGGYTLAGVYSKDGYALNSGAIVTEGGRIPDGATRNIRGGNMLGDAIITGTLPNGNQYTYADGKLTEYTHAGSLTGDQRAGATQMSLGGGTQVDNTGAGASGILNNVNQAYSGNVDAYRNDYTKQSTNMAAAQAQAQTQSDSAYILNYMVQNNGALPPVYKPGMSGVPMSQAAFDAAAAEYKANNSSSYLRDATFKAPDTSAVDQNGLAALLSLNSQYRTGAMGADTAAYQASGAANSIYQSGQNTLAHNADYADKYNVNLGVYNDAVTKSFEANKQAIGQKLNQDIQSMGDLLLQLQQGAQQLGTQSQQAITQQIRNLRNQISDYQVAAAQLGANNDRVVKMGTAILELGGQLASAGAA